MLGRHLVTAKRGKGTDFTDIVLQERVPLQLFSIVRPRAFEEGKYFPEYLLNLLIGGGQI